MANQSAMTGPNRRPTLPVPRHWMTNSPMMIMAEIGSTNSRSSGAATSRPSTAERTEIAGVSKPSPKNRQAPPMPTRVERPADPCSRRDALGQRHQREDAALATVVGAHHQQHVLHGDDQHERPEHQREDALHLESRDAVFPEMRETGSERVERAGADVAIDDAEHAEQHAEANAPARADGGAGEGDGHALASTASQTRPTSASVRSGWIGSARMRPERSSETGSATPSCVAA